MMIGVTVIRKQHAVGHGGFHTGEILVLQTREKDWPGRYPSYPMDEAPEHPLLKHSYVYDCGSEHTAALRYSLGRHLESRSDTDTLFVSHMHADHVAGIDNLVLGAPASTVVAPYLAPEDLAALALSDLERGARSSLTIEYIENPVRWWRRRGAKRIIFIEPDPGGEAHAVPPDAVDPPDELPDGPEGSAIARMTLPRQTGPRATFIMRPL